MGYKILKVIIFLVSLFPVVAFSIAAYISFTGKGPWGNFEGILFLVSALVFLLMAVKLPGIIHTPLSKEKIEQLKASGQKLMTEFKALDRRWNIQINGQSPIVVFSQSANGEVFQSEDLWFSGQDASAYNDPRFQAWQKLQSIDPNKKYLIPVYQNPSNPKEYYMDLAGLKIG